MDVLVLSTKNTWHEAVYTKYCHIYLKFCLLRDNGLLYKTSFAQGGVHHIVFMSHQRVLSTLKHFHNYVLGNCERFFKKVYYYTSLFSPPSYRDQFSKKKHLEKLKLTTLLTWWHGNAPPSRTKKRHYFLQAVQAIYNPL